MHFCTAGLEAVVSRESIVLVSAASIFLFTLVLSQGGVQFKDHKPHEDDV